MTEKERLCVIEWINNGFNGTQAYMTVFKNCKKSSAARVSFCKMMKKDDVRAFRDEMINNLESSEIASAGEVLIFLTRVVRGLEKDAFGLDASIDDRLKAADKLMKAKGMFTQKVEITNDAEDEKTKAISNIESLMKQMVPVKEDEISE